MIKDILISEEFGIPSEPYPGDLAGRPYPEQIGVAGVAYYPDLMDDMEEPIRLLRGWLDQACRDADLVHLASMYSTAQKVDAFRAGIFDGTKSDKVGKPAVPFFMVGDEIETRLREQAVPLGFSSSGGEDVIIAKSYPYGGGMGRRGDINQSLVNPLTTISLDEDRDKADPDSVTEIITPDGRLFSIASKMGGLLVLPQACGADSDKRVEYAVKGLKKVGFAHTIQYFSRKLEEQPIDPERLEVDKARWDKSRAILIGEAA